MRKLNCAVIGTGYLGRFHAQKFKLLEQANLVAVCDRNQETLKAVSQELEVPGVSDHNDLLGKVDAVSIAATTNQHYEIAKTFLEHGVHVLIEKPITETVAQAEALVNLAKKNKLKLQVGHLEQFNAAKIAIEPYLTNPKFIESTRLAPFNPRGSDVNVILDLMIHDIDLLQSIVKSPVEHIDAQGAAILTSGIDIANARLRFENGCVANVTASRISFKSERKTRIFQPEAYISIDYQNKKFAIFNKGEGEMFPGIPEIVQHQSQFEKSDPLLDEIKAFLQCIIEDGTPVVTGEDGMNALNVAEQITECIYQNLEAAGHSSKQALKNQERDTVC
jgi:predicted dehydrogenase